MKINWYRLKRVGKKFLLVPIGGFISIASLGIMTPLTLNPATWVINFILLVMFICGVAIFIAALLED